jgi:hypothetical protein
LTALRTGRPIESQWLQRPLTGCSVSALEDPDSEAVLAAVCDIAQARGMADVAATKRKGL